MVAVPQLHHAPCRRRPNRHRRWRPVHLWPPIQVRRQQSSRRSRSIARRRWPWPRALTMLHFWGVAWHGKLHCLTCFHTQAGAGAHMCIYGLSLGRCCCRDEFHSRLKFNHRGLVACANQVGRTGRAGRQADDRLKWALLRAVIAVAWPPLWQPWQPAGSHRQQAVCLGSRQARSMPLSAQHLWSSVRDSQLS